MGWRVTPSLRFASWGVASVASGVLVLTLLVMAPAMFATPAVGGQMTTRRLVWEPSPQPFTTRFHVVLEGGRARVLNLDTDSADELARLVATDPGSLVTVAHEFTDEDVWLVAPIFRVTQARLYVDGAGAGSNAGRAAITAFAAFWHQTYNEPAEAPRRLQPDWRGIAYHAALAAAAVACALSLARLPGARRAQRLARGLCPRCAYDVRGQRPGEPRCPECGAAWRSSP